MSLLSVIYRLNAISINIPVLFYRNRKKILKFIKSFMWNYKGPYIAKTIMRKNNKGGGLTFPDIKIHHKAAVTKPIWPQRKGIVDQWN